MKLGAAFLYVKKFSETSNNRNTMNKSGYMSKEALLEQEEHSGAPASGLSVRLCSEGVQLPHFFFFFLTTKRGSKGFE